MTILYKGNQNGKTTVPRIVPPIPLQKPEAKALEKGEYHTYKLRSNPGDNDSPTYELSVPYFSTGTCEEYLKFRTNFDKVCTGQNITTGPGKFTLARRLLEGDALTSFDNKATELAGTETNQSCVTCLNAVRDGVFPQRAVLTQKRYMRRALQKPRTMTTREWLARVFELNNFLTRFPGTGTPEVRPNKMDDDEIKEIAEYGIPYQWQRQMRVLNFNATEKTVPEFIDFCKRLENLEGDDDKKASETSGTKRKRNTTPTTTKSNKDKKVEQEGNKYCMFHGENDTHDTEDCFALKKFIKKTKASPKDKTKTPKYTTNKEEFNTMFVNAFKAMKKADKAKRARDQQTVNEELNAFDGISLSSDKDI